MRMQEFKEGKIAVYAETTKEATRFLKACEKEGLRWNDGAVATEPILGGKAEIAYRFRNCHGLSWTHSGRGWHSHYPDPDRPYKSVTVGEFFDEPERLGVAAVTDLSFEAFKQGQYAVTFKNPRRGDPEVEAFLKACKAKGLDVDMMCDLNIRPGIKSDIRHLFGAHCHVVPEIPYTSVPWAQSQKRERVTIYRTADGRVECVHTLDGKEVGKASVTRYYKDTDDFLTAAKFAIAKLPAAEVGKALRKPLPPFGKDGRPNYKVGQKVRMKKGYAHPEAFVGEIVKVEHDGYMAYCVREPIGMELWQHNRNVLGLAEEPLPPYDEQGNLLWRVGQKVQMRKGWLWPKPFVGEIVSVCSRTHADSESMSGYFIREPDGVSFWQRTADIVGLAE